VRGTLLVSSIGVALHLVPPQISGIERSLRLGAVFYSTLRRGGRDRCPSG